MTSRRDSLRALFAGTEPESAGQGSGAPVPAPETKALVPGFIRGETAPQPRAPSGALKAMGLELEGLRRAAEEAEALRAQLAAGGAVLEIDPALIDEAFLRDRMPSDPEADAALEASLAASGQQVPTLVRPHREKPGRYEAVFGHRRIAALRRLGRPVRTVVRVMSDEELVVAQGQENTQRRDLTFIERARYASSLEGRGFSRAIIMAALDAHASDIARYLAVMERLPGALIEAVGPAPKAGRPRWLSLAESLEPGRRMPPAVRAVVERPEFRAMASDARFAAVFTAVRAGSGGAAPPSPPPAAVWRSADGALLAGRRRRKGGAALDLAGPEAEAFADWLGGQLEALHGAFRHERGGGGSSGA